MNPGQLALTDGAPPNIPSGKGGGKQSKGKDKHKGPRAVRTRNGPANERLCVKYNDKRGCHVTDCQFKHRCDAVLKSTGAACMGKHTAIEHDGRRDGEVKMAN